MGPCTWTRKGYGVVFRAPGLNGMDLVITATDDQALLVSWCLFFLNVCFFGGLFFWGWQKSTNGYIIVGLGPGGLDMWNPRK